MTAIFISHRSSDNAEAQALKDWLDAQGHQQLFLDFDPADGIPAGVDWEQRLYQELRRCQALLIVLTPAWLESMWCRNEFAIAREKGKATFVVRVKPCAAGPVIPAIQEVDLTCDREAALAKLARGLKEHGLDPASAFDWRPGRPIYPGLAAFEIDDAAVYFGRSDESWQVVETLRRMRLQPLGSPKLLLITGASGSGKSSLMRAGVLARLRKEQASWIIGRPFRRGGDGLTALADALAWAYPPGSRPASLQTLSARLAEADGAGQLIAIARELRLALDRPEATLVLALDQAEEVLAAEQAEDSGRLLDLLRAAAVGSSNELLVLATIRTDRLGEWQKHDSVKATAEHGELPFEVLPLGPMPMARIGEIVRGPATYEGLRVEDELVQAIRAETDTPDALPLLAYTLRYLHDRFAGDGRLTLMDYQSFGGLEGSIRSQADAAIPIDHLPEADRRALREAFVPGLVRATLADTFSRRRARMATLPSRAEPYLRRLIDDARLLQTDRDLEGQVTVEVAHEALLRVWPTLIRWIEEDAQNLRRLAAVQRAAADWAANARGTDFVIHRDHRLAEAELLVSESRFAARLEDVDREYLATCRTGQDGRDAQEREARERELQAARELAARRRSQLRWAGVATLISLILMALAGWQWLEASSAQTRAEKARKIAVDGLTEATWKLGGALSPSEEMSSKESWVFGTRALYTWVTETAGLLNLATLQSLSPVPVFTKGPHKTELNLKASEFGYYNPAFVRWARDHAIPALKDETLRQLSQPFYDARLKYVAREYYDAYQYLQSDPDLLAGTVRGYLEKVQKDPGVPGKFLNPSSRYLQEQFRTYANSPTVLKGAPGNEDHFYLAVTAGGFWVRRNIDGTDEEFFSLLEELLSTYDKPWLDQWQAR